MIWLPVESDSEIITKVFKLPKFLKLIDFTVSTLINWV